MKNITIHTMSKFVVVGLFVLSLAVFPTFNTVHADMGEFGVFDGGDMGDGGFGFFDGGDMGDGGYGYFDGGDYDYGDYGSYDGGDYDYSGDYGAYDGGDYDYGDYGSYDGGDYNDGDYGSYDGGDYNDYGDYGAYDGDYDNDGYADAYEYGNEYEQSSYGSQSGSYGSSGGSSMMSQVQQMLTRGVSSQAQQARVQYVSQPQRYVQYSPPPVYQQPPVYQPPYVPPVVQPRPYCTITASQTYVQTGNASVMLNWSSGYAYTASLTQVGNVPVNGSRQVWVSHSTTYVLTVTGQGGTANCQTTVTVQPPVYIPPQPPVYVPPVYIPPTPPIYYPPQQNLYCTLSASPSSIQNGQTTFLNWTSSGGVVSAQLNDGLGRVNPTGSMGVRPEMTRSYTLTVWGTNGQTAVCSTIVSVTGAPYVALTQIPYTGFDFGPFGNAMYWAALILAALAGAYLIVYFQGGSYRFLSAFASNFGVRLPARRVRTRVAASVANDDIQIAIPRKVIEAPVVHQAVVEAPVAGSHAIAHATHKAADSDAHTSLGDSMYIDSSGSVPRIVIKRA